MMEYDGREPLRELRELSCAYNCSRFLVAFFAIWGSESCAGTVERRLTGSQFKFKALTQYEPNGVIKFLHLKSFILFKITYERIAGLSRQMFEHNLSIFKEFKNLLLTHGILLNEMLR